VGALARLVAASFGQTAGPARETRGDGVRLENSSSSGHPAPPVASNKPSDTPAAGVVHAVTDTIPLLTRYQRKTALRAAMTALRSGDGQAACFATVGLLQLTAKRHWTLQPFESNILFSQRDND